MRPERSSVRVALPFITAFVTLIYGVLDFSGLMDRVQGRESALAIWQRLSTVSSGDSVIMFDDEPDFTKGAGFLTRHSRNPAVREAHLKGIAPTAIGRIGGIDTPQAVGEFPRWDTITRFYASPSSPLFVGYNYKRAERSAGWGYSLGSLGEITEFVNESRERERFLVYTILLGSLSLIIALQEIAWNRHTK